MKEGDDRMAAGAGGVLIYRPKRIFNFPKRLGIEFATEMIESLLAAFLLAQTRITSFSGKVGFILTAGILASIATNIPYAHSYGFPKTSTLTQMVMMVV